MGQSHAECSVSPNCPNSFPPLFPHLSNCSSQGAPTVRLCLNEFPLFLIPKPSGLTILTAPMVSSTLASLLRSLHLNPSCYGFHSFRRSAVSWAADHNVPLQNLQAHGGWASSAIYSYLKHTPKASSRVANTFQQVLTTH